MIKTQIKNRLKLLLELIPHVLDNQDFALKGGTAINLFCRDMPRASVDIDLNYLPIEERKKSLSCIDQLMKNAEKKIKNIYPELQFETKTLEGQYTFKLDIRRGPDLVKIEPNAIFRGCVYPCEERHLCQKAQDMFEMFVSIKTMSLADLYGGKIRATLDRQHPRDLFDIKILLENEGINNKIRKAFVIYLASSSRPMSELLDPQPVDIKQAYETQFKGMTEYDVSYNDLMNAKNNLLSVLKKDLTNAERNFLLSIKEGNPKWHLMDSLDLDNVKKLPAIHWKIRNIKNMDTKKHQLALQKLKETLDL